jgi:hypothetical protein
MGQRFGRFAAGAIAAAATFLTALIGSAASAGSIGFSQDRENSLRGSSCDSAEGCARISGYIKAGTDFPVRAMDDRGPARIAPPPSTGKTADGLTLGVFPLDNGRNEETR